MAVLVPNLVLRGPWREGIWTETDSGVFLYSGWRVLHGEIPYRDFWDHKWPLIYYLDAVGLWLGSGSVWGVFVLELLAITCACALCYLAMRIQFGSTPALVATTAMLAGLSLTIYKGNLTEEYALPFTFLTLYLFSRATHAVTTTSANAAPPWTYALIGMTGTIPILLKPNLGGTLIAIGLYLAWCVVTGPRRMRAAWQLGAAVAGSCIVVVALVLFFLLNDAFTPFIDTAIRFNLDYSAHAHPLGRFRLAVTALDLLAPSMLPQIAIVGWIAAVLATALALEIRRPALARLALIAFPLELALVGTSGRWWPQYAMAMLPVAAILVGSVLHMVIHHAGIEARNRRLQQGIGASLAMIAVVTLPLLMSVSASGYELFRHQDQGADPVLEVVSCLRSDEAAQGPVLVWGNAPSVNFFARREVPTRFSYQFGVFFGGERYENARELLDALEERPPVYIIDTVETSTSTWLPPLGEPGRQQWLESHYSTVGDPRSSSAGELEWAPEYRALWEFVDSNYDPAIRSDSGSGQEWVVYELTSRPDIEGSWQEACSG